MLTSTSASVSKVISAKKNSSSINLIPFVPPSLVERRRDGLRLQGQRQLSPHFLLVFHQQHPLLLIRFLLCGYFGVSAIPLPSSTVFLTLPALSLSLALCRWGLCGPRCSQQQQLRGHLFLGHPGQQARLIIASCLFRELRTLGRISSCFPLPRPPLSNIL
jgi:hypothetical protein